MFLYWCPSSDYFNATARSPTKYFEHFQPDFLYVLPIASKPQIHNICCVYGYFLLFLKMMGVKIHCWQSWTWQFSVKETPSWILIVTFYPGHDLGYSEVYFLDHVSINLIFYCLLFNSIQQLKLYLLKLIKVSIAIK